MLLSAHMIRPRKILSLFIHLIQFSSFFSPTHFPPLSCRVKRTVAPSPPLPLRGEKRNIPYHFPLLPSFPPAASASSYNARLFPTSPRDPWRKDSRALIFREISFSPPPPVSCRGRSNTLLSFGGILALANQPCKGRGEEEGGSFACPSPPFLPLSLGATVEGRRRSNRDGYTAILALSLLLTTLQHMPNEV